MWSCKRTVMAFARVVCLAIVLFGYFFTLVFTVSGIAANRFSQRRVGFSPFRIVFQWCSLCVMEIYIFFGGPIIASIVVLVMLEGTRGFAVEACGGMCREIMRAVVSLICREESKWLSAVHSDFVWASQRRTQS